MKRGVPNTYNKVVEAARECGYVYDYSTGGHDFYINPDPEKKWGQQKKLTIPTEIKGTKTLYNILDGMGYFEKYNLNHAGHERKPQIDHEELRRAERKKLAKDVSLTREWKKAMRQYARGILPGKPAPLPHLNLPKPANTP